MYEELVERLRKRAVNLKEKFSRNAELLLELTQAADAIEELEQTVEHYRGCSDDWYKEACDYKAMLPRWIPVTERLPEERMAVIVYAPYMKNEFMAYWTGSRWMVWAAGEYEREMPEYHQITHWMPLPEPPKEKS